MTESTLRIAEWSLATAAVSFGLSNAFVDNLPTIRANCRQPDAPQYLADLRSAYASAGLLSTLVGLGVTLVLGSPWPVLAAAGASGAMIYVYERQIPGHQRLLTTPRGDVIDVARGVGYRRIP